MENCRIEGQEPQDMINTNDQHLGNIIRPRSNTCPNLYAASNSRKLKHGSKVIILGTDNVEQRVPQYVGAEAIIVDVPGNKYHLQSLLICFSSSFNMV